MPVLNEQQIKQLRQRLTDDEIRRTAAVRNFDLPDSFQESSEPVAQEDGSQDGFFSPVARGAKAVGKALTRSTRAFGESLGGAAFAAGVGDQGTQEELGKARNFAQNQLNSFAKEVQRKREAGEDVTNLVERFNRVNKNSSAPISDEQINTALTKSNQQILGEAVGTAGEVLGLGSGLSGFAKATAPAVGIGAGIKAGALAGSKAGAAFGAVEGGAQALQRDGDVADTAAGALFGAGFGGIAGGAIGGALGGVTGALGARLARKQQVTDLVTQAPDLPVSQKLASNVQLSAQGKIAVRNGIEEANVKLVEQAVPADKTVMNSMLQTAKNAQTNKTVLTRPSDKVGEVFVEDVRKVLEVNKTAGKQLDEVANSTLKGNKTDYGAAFNSLVDDLESAGVQVGDDFSVNFKGSDFEGITGAQNSITNLWNRVRPKDGETLVDSLNLHRTKRFVDNVVSYGKQTEGLVGDAERILKSFRRNIDGALDTQFPAYNQVNTQLSDTFQILDEVGDIMGRKFNAGDELANVRAGAVMRRVLGNSGNRQDIMQTIASVEEYLKQTGRGGDNDMVSLILFNDMLEELFGTQATTGLQGQTERAVRGAVEAAGPLTQIATGNFTTGVASGINKFILRKSPEKAITALEGILSAAQ